MSEGDDFLAVRCLHNMKSAYCSSWCVYSIEAIGDADFCAGLKHVTDIPGARRNLTHLECRVTRLDKTGMVHQNMHLQLPTLAYIATLMAIWQATMSISEGKFSSAPIGEFGTVQDRHECQVKQRYAKRGS